MVEVRCPDCLLIWQEDRKRGDGPFNPPGFKCPRCDTLGEFLHRGCTACGTRNRMGTAVCRCCGNEL